MKRAVRIINNDGIGGNTKIIDVETGEDLTPFLKIRKIVLAVDEIVTAEAEVVVPRVDVVAEIYIDEGKEWEKNYDEERQKKGDR